MKIAVLIDTWFPFVGGGQINALEISKCLAKKGIQLEIITRNNGRDKLKFPKNLTVVKLGAKSEPENNLAKLMYLVNSFVYVYKKDFDLVHAHAFYSGITARLLMVTKGIPAILTVHGTSHGTKLNSIVSRLAENFILTKILYSAQITVSRDFLKVKNINKQSFSSNKKVIYIPNGVEKYFLKNIKLKKRNQILTVARLHPQKNLVNLVKAFNIVLNEYPNYKLVIAGDGPQRIELLNLVNGLKLKKKINFLGEVNNRQLIKFYSESKLFVLPSFYEGQPLSLLEALASRLPVIGARTGDIPFLIKDSINGYLINKPTDPTEIAIVIKKALKNKNLGKLSAKLHDLVRNKFTWDIAARQTFQIYEKVTKAKS